MVVIGWGCITLGGLVAAVTGPLDLTHGSWLAAYLVLVGGVAQVAMGSMGRRRATHVQLAAWNGGNLAVIGGALITEPLLVDLGSLLLGAIVLALLAVRSSGRHAGGTGGQVPALVLWAYRSLLVALAVSIPIGIVLSHARHG